MKPTRHVVITPEGMARKQARMLTQLLQSRHPFLYSELMDEVIRTIEFDQANPYSTVTGNTHTKKVSRASKVASGLKRLEAAEAIKQHYVPNILPIKVEGTIVKDTK